MAERGEREREREMEVSGRHLSHSNLVFLCPSACSFLCQFVNDVYLSEYALARSTNLVTQFL
jgi:hypothetical protein